MTNGMNLWGRDFSLPVYYECDSDQGVLDIQKEAKDTLLASWNTVEDSKEAIEDYCLEETAIRSRAPLQTFLCYSDQHWVSEAMILAKRHSCATIALTPNMGLLRYLKRKNLRPSSPKTSFRPVTSNRITKVRSSQYNVGATSVLLYACPAYTLSPNSSSARNSSCLGLQRP